jgi:hypothetical protein
VSRLASKNAARVVCLGLTAFVACGEGRFSSCEELQACRPDGEGGGIQAGAGGEASPESGAGGEAGDDGGEFSLGGISGIGGAGGSGGEGSAPPTCDPSLSPGEEPCAVSETYAVFVSPRTGSDTADGTRDAPLKSLSRALELAAETERFVIACAETFDETLLITQGVRIFGGFACPEAVAATDDAWEYRPHDKTHVLAPYGALALDVVDIQSPVLVQDIAFESRDAPKPGASSIAARISGSVDVILERVLLVAGDGVDGADGVLEEFTYAGAVPNGEAATELSGGAPTAFECPNGSVTRGGRGGLPSQDGNAGAPYHGGPGGEGGGASRECGWYGGGLDGAAGPNGANAIASQIRGSLSGLLWVPANGEPGEDGLPGQGGGGGAGKPGGGGGSGGCGGCGGKAGAPGQGGGASIALLSIDSTVSLIASELVSGRAGDGGSGTVGQLGQSAGGGWGRGFGTTAGAGCNGGMGGPGGNGGSGSGGPGGISVGILHAGPEPTRTSTTIIPGTRGAKGLGGNPGSNDGLDGLSQPLLVNP